MLAANYTEFRAELKRYLDMVEDDNELLVIKRGKGKGMMLMSMDEYNSLMETVYLLSSRKNAAHLHESMEQIKKKKIIRHKLIEE